MTPIETGARADADIQSPDFRNIAFRRLVLALTVAAVVTWVPATAEAQRGQRGGDRSAKAERSKPERSKSTDDSARSEDSRIGERSGERGEREGGDAQSLTSKLGGDGEERSVRTELSSRSDGGGRNAASQRSVEEGRSGLAAESRRSGDSARAGETQLSPAQQAQVQALRSDLSGLGQGAVAAEDEIRELASDLQSMALEPPDPVLVEALASDLHSALGDSTLSPVEMAQLSQSVYAVLNSAGLDSGEVQVLLNDVEAVLEAADVSRSDIEAVMSSLSGVAGSVQGTPPPSSGGRSSGRRFGGRR